MRRMARPDHKTWRRRALPALAAIWFGLGRSPIALAAQLQLPVANYNYTVLNGDLADALRQFGDDVRLRVSVSGEVKGRIRGRVSASSPRAFLDLVTALYGLDWYYDGYTLYVTANAEGQTRLIDVPDGDAVSLQKALDAGDVTDTRFPLRVLPGSNRIMVSGPPRYVDLVTQTAAAMSPQAVAHGVSASAETTTVYRGSSREQVSFPR